MIRADVIKTALIGGVGFRNPTDSEFNIVDDTNQGSTSGLYFDDASNFVTIQNIKDCQPDKNISNDEFNAYLQNIHKQVIDDVCREVVGNQSKMIHSINLYKEEKPFSETITPKDGFVGFEIYRKYNTSDLQRVTDRLSGRNSGEGNFIGVVPWVELYFDTAVTFNLYLFNSNKRVAIKTKEVTTLANESVIVNIGDWFIDDSINVKGGTFYIGYFESDLGEAKPIRNINAIRTTQDFYYIYPVRINQESNILDIRNMEYISDPHGLNMGLNIHRDYTNLLLDNRSLIFPAIQLGFGVKVLDIIRTSIRSNLTERLTKEVVQSIEFELYGNPEQRIEGLKTKYVRRITDIKKTLFYEPMLTIGTGI